jgi:hypothetical protein
VRRTRFDTDVVHPPFVVHGEVGIADFVLHGVVTGALEVEEHEGERREMRKWGGTWAERAVKREGCRGSCARVACFRRVLEAQSTLSR